VPFPDSRPTIQETITRLTSGEGSRSTTTRVHSTELTRRYWTFYGGGLLCCPARHRSIFTPQDVRTGPGPPNHWYFVFSVVLPMNGFTFGLWSVAMKLFITLDLLDRNSDAHASPPRWISTRASLSPRAQLGKSGRYINPKFPIV
jgi:hypothetical protein